MGSITEELVGRNCNTMRLFMKIIPKLEHHINTACGFSKGFYSNNIELAGTGQGNKCS